MQMADRGAPVAKPRQRLSRHAFSAGLTHTRRPELHANWLANLRSAMVQLGACAGAAEEEACTQKVCGPKHAQGLEEDDD